MTPSQLFVTQPGPLVLLLAGAGWFWWSLRSLRSKLRATADIPDGQTITPARDALLASSLRFLVTGAIMAILGFCLTFASAGLVSLALVLQVAGVVMCFVIVGCVYHMIRGAPRPVWRWLLADEKI